MNYAKRIFYLTAALGVGTCLTFADTSSTASNETSAQSSGQSQVHQKVMAGEHHRDQRREEIFKKYRAELEEMHKEQQVLKEKIRALYEKRKALCEKRHEEKKKHEELKQHAQKKQGQESEQKSVERKEICKEEHAAQRAALEELRAEEQALKDKRHMLHEKEKAIREKMRLELGKGESHHKPQSEHKESHGQDNPPPPPPHVEEGASA